MGLFSNKNTNTRYGAIVEIGSGSILTAIVASNPTEQHPDIIWSRREFAILSIEQDFNRSLKSLMTTLMNSVMILDAEGRTALQNHAPHAVIDTMQVSISAPWSYTISKIIEYTQDAPFTITESLIESLIKKANERTLEVLKESEKSTSATLAIMTRATTDITANGYHTSNPINQSAKSVTLTQVSAIAETLITSIVTELKEKVFASSVLERYSTMLVYHCIVRELYASMTEYCLVDITYEATEIAIVRDGVLQYSTHTSIGINTLVRNLAIRLDVPEADANSMLKSIFQADSLAGQSEKITKAVTTLFAEYQQALETLFQETGDSLTIPKVLFLHSSIVHERYFDDYVIAAAKKATNSSHTVHTISNDILTHLYPVEARRMIEDSGIDSGVLMTAQFFHKQHHCSDFTQV